MRLRFSVSFWKTLCVGTAVFALSTQALASATLAGSKPKHHFTEVRLITPFTAEGLNASINITKRVSGSCWSNSSKDTSRPNTWRCQAENQSYDPCFMDPIREGSKVICLVSPWNLDAVEIALDAPLPSNRSESFDYKSAQPWALELSNGNHCSLISGPSLIVAGMKSTYRCKDGTIVGDIDRSHKVWTVLYNNDKNLYMSQKTVVTAWY